MTAGLPWKAEVSRLPPYDLPSPRARVKVDLNESPYDFPADLKDEVWARVRERSWSRYPRHPPIALTTALERRLSWPKEGIVAGNGSNELIQAILSVALSPGTSFLVPRPSFPVYAILGTIHGGDVRFLDLDADFAYREELLASAIAATCPRVVLLCSPNNPTGTVASGDVVRLALDDPSRLVILDEAYQDFAAENLFSLLASHENLVILRTFSKAWGLAGLRIGYLLAHPAVAREIGKAVLPFNLNVFSEACALVALEHEERLRETVERIKESRAALFAAMAALPGVRPYESQSNFILFETPLPPQKIYDALLARGVLVRDVSRGHRLERALRVSVGTPEENAIFLRELGARLATGP
ncbi:MAG: histidinol-phosphate transaminase [Acidobacteriota bacterium]